MIKARTLYIPDMPLREITVPSLAWHLESPELTAL